MKENSVEFMRISELVNNPKCWKNYDEVDKLLAIFKTIDIKSCEWIYSTTDNNYTLWYNPPFKLYFIDDRVSNSVLELHQLEDNPINRRKMILNFDKIVHTIEGD